MPSSPRSCCVWWSAAAVRGQVGLGLLLPIAIHTPVAVVRTLFPTVTLPVMLVALLVAALVYRRGQGTTAEYGSEPVGDGVGDSVGEALGDSGWRFTRRWCRAWARQHISLRRCERVACRPNHTVAAVLAVPQEDAWDLRAADDLIGEARSNVAPVPRLSDRSNSVRRWLSLPDTNAQIQICRRSPQARARLVT